MRISDLKFFKFIYGGLTGLAVGLLFVAVGLCNLRAKDAHLASYLAFEEN